MRQRLPGRSAFCSSESPLLKVRPLLLVSDFLGAARAELGPGFMEHPPNSYREATRMMPKPCPSLKGFLANRATNRGGCCASATGDQNPEKTFSSSFPGSCAAIKALPTK